MKSPNGTDWCDRSTQVGSFTQEGVAADLKHHKRKVLLLWLYIYLVYELHEVHQECFSIDVSFAPLCLALIIISVTDQSFLLL